MRLYFNLDTLQLQLDPSFPQAIIGLTTRFADGLNLEIGMVRSGNSATVNIGTTPAMKFLVKPAGSFDSDPLLEVVAWSQSIADDLILYSGTVTVAGGRFEKLLGIDPLTQSEKVAIQTVADASSSLAGRYFNLPESPTSTVRVWFTVSGSGTAPATPAGGRLLPVALVTGDNANIVAAKLATALEADAAFSATVSGAVVTNTVVAQIAVPDCSSGSSGFALTVLQSGAVAGTLTDVPEVTAMCELSVVYAGARQTTARYDFIIQNTLDRSSAVASLIGSAAFYTAAQADAQFVAKNGPCQVSYIDVASYAGPVLSAIHTSTDTTDATVILAEASDIGYDQDLYQGSSQVGRVFRVSYDGFITCFGFKNPVRLPGYTVVDMPDAGDWEFAQIFVSDEVGGACVAFSDGTQWRRVSDNAVVS